MKMEGVKNLRRPSGRLSQKCKKRLFFEVLYFDYQIVRLKNSKKTGLKCWFLVCFFVSFYDGMGCFTFEIWK